ncbi:hypothetical protein QBC35DRAFT_236080 [Podospora australis]|uniref:Extracellular membrane protein CFEM domain-containing protein n=1 Tax=Podospora australis TaxID=1536484 RepID=A0AAN7AHZ5_9PEZI|nr:hypothetical protein QBC35DRAFT_236080 [Podospora australis]
MKTSTIAAFLAPAVAVNGQWHGGAPECAQGCFSSFWSSATTQNAWPAPTAYCTANPVASCVSSACSATPTAVASYASLSSSVCSQWSSCTASGTPSVYTVSAPAFTGAWGPGKYGPPGGRNPWNGAHGDGEWTRTWTGGVYTVTGCEWDGNPWAGGPGGWGQGGAGGSPWGYWGKDWKWSTETKTVTRVVTSVDNGITRKATSVGLATVALAASGDSTTTSFVQAQATGNSNAAAGGRAGDVEGGVKIMGAVLGGVVAVAGLL